MLSNAVKEYAGKFQIQVGDINTDIANQPHTLKLLTTVREHMIYVDASASPLSLQTFTNRAHGITGSQGVPLLVHRVRVLADGQ